MNLTVQHGPRLVLHAGLCHNNKFIVNPVAHGSHYISGTDIQAENQGLFEFSYITHLRNLLFYLHIYCPLQLPERFLHRPVIVNHDSAAAPVYLLRKLAF